jgi:hypothetical protein
MDDFIHGYHRGRGSKTTTGMMVTHFQIVKFLGAHANEKISLLKLTKQQHESWQRTS